ncbi:PucR family transcriptional regulator [Mycobacterium shimoidei]|uniref:PucR family transcriptional regulator [Actinosynnema mirum DSM] n=1 Tax=Mycobacterium shimoidei TaxID=29313 RepID=A0A1E3TIF5_MYCSH|nr:PucR family transcriptional regulator [Mycobacterium shimoidei]MCV7257895.1 helix-turn-helix domain-containing protein [Mycobacterium shimoidei]ODR14161.1 PucR family transcriptional regulator [Mycobacterium shimoidei]ORW83943.1 PucR family transcriptional regulator [Mycobacterium shimoidei]SRX91866.1 PucR family transcriptional regulator [Actinosynnema mirum DSM] [Mycobacterium shimoidei]
MITLDRLVNVLGNYGVRLRWSSVPRTTELRSVVMRETGDRPVVGDVLLAIGADSVSEAAQWAVAARAVVVLMRGGEEPITFDGTEVGAVMVADEAVSWSELAAVVYGLVLEGRETESGRGPTDLFALADSLAEAIGDAVVIHDESLRVLAYSKLQRHTDAARIETILGRQTPEHLRELFEARGVFAHLASSDDPLFVAGDAEHGVTGRMVIAVRSARELIGSVWVACEEPLNDAARTALADGAHTVALHLLRSRASADLERQVESELVIRLLEGAADAATLASRLGVPQSPLRVIALQASIGADRDAALLMAFERATAGFGWSRPGRSALAGNTVYTLLPGEEAADARRWISGVRAALPEDVTVLAGISGTAKVVDVPAARHEADECLALHEMTPSAAPPAYDESWDEILLQRLRTAARKGRYPERGPVADLRRHDRANATEYVATLRAWLEAQGDPIEAGERLSVHENTVRYRLRKMSEITKLPLDDARKRLAMMIELAAIDAD